MQRGWRKLMKGGKKSESKKRKREAERCPMKRVITAFLKLNLAPRMFVQVV